MPKKTARYTSIEEIRSSLYPSSAGMLDLKKGEILDFPSSMSGKTRKIMEDIADAGADASETEESTSDE